MSKQKKEVPVHPVQLALMHFEKEMNNILDHMETHIKELDARVKAVEKKLENK